MKITIDQPVGFNEAGARSNNEDSIFPDLNAATVADRLFLVCDGVGGEHKGEVASTLACQALHTFFEESLKGDRVTSEILHSALAYTTQLFENAEKADPDTAGMATTMTMVHFQDDGVAVAHLGDSRIYQVRHGKVIYRSKDHKWVNELVESGVITEQQALEHPKRNVITRVISAGRNDQPAFVLIGDVQPGDYFFMCTDGVLERLYDSLLEYHLGDGVHNGGGLQPIMEAIREESLGKTNDNFSAYLIRVAHVEVTSREYFNGPAEAASDQKKKVSEVPATDQSSNQRSFKWLFLGLTGGALCVLILVYWWKSNHVSIPDQVQKSQIPIGDSSVVLPVEQVPETKVINEKKASGKGTLKRTVAFQKSAQRDSVVSVSEIRKGDKEAPEQGASVPVGAVEPVVKSEKSDLPAKLKRIDPKPNDQE